MTHIVFIAPGSRGDIQPYVALGKGLHEAGHTVRIVTHLNYEQLVQAHGLEFWQLEADIQEIVQNEKMRAALEGGSLLLSMAQMSKVMERQAIRLAERSLDACKHMDLIIAGFGGLFVALAVAEKTGLPFLQAYNVPFTPTSAFPGALLPGLPQRLGANLNRLTHRLTQQFIWQAYRPADNVVRRQTLNLRSNSFWGPFGQSVLSKSPVLYGFSPSVIPAPVDWDSRQIHVTGYWNLEPDESWRPPEDLERFLETGDAPVYIGFGSMSSRKPQQTSALIFEALELTNQRAVVFSGWGGLHKENLPDYVHMIDSTPHSWLFPRLAAVVHHGGAGTTAAGLRAGIPSIVVPFHGDQPFWGARVAALGVGPAPIRRGRLTAKKLAEALQTALTDREMRMQAAELGEKIRTEDGIERAVQVIQQLPSGFNGAAFLS